MKFTIFSTVPNVRGLRRTEVEEVDEAGVLRAARLREVLEDEETYDIVETVETNCQETGKRLRQVEQSVNRTKRGRW